MLERSVYSLSFTDAILKLVGKDEHILVSLLQLHIQPILSKKVLYISGEEL